MRTYVWLLLSLLATSITWIYAARVLQPWEYYVNVEHGKLKALIGDLYSPWMGTRELLLHGRNPYSPEVSREIQMAFYGHAINQRYGEPGVNPVDEQRFAYPVYVVFLLAPTVYMDFQTLKTWAAIIFAMLTAVSVLLWLDVLQWRARMPIALAAATVLFVLSSPPVVQGLRLRQLGLAVGFLLAVSAWCAARNYLLVAGIALALSTIKPQMVVFPLTFFLLWGVSAGPKRWPLLAGFGATLAVLAALGLILLPQWPRYFLQGLVAYRGYAPSPSLLCLALGNAAGLSVSVVVAVGLLAFMWRNRLADAASSKFLQVLSASFLATTLLLPLLPPFNQVLLLLPALIIARDWAAMPSAGRRLFAAMVAWPWITSLVLFLFHPRLDSPSFLPLLPAAIAVFAPFLLSILFAIRARENDEPQLEISDLRS